MKGIKIAGLSDFTGGLNLRADAFQLAGNESPDLMNVDVDPRGGFRQRNGVAPFGSGLTGTPHSLFLFENAAPVRQVLAAVGTQVSVSTGGAFSNAFTMTNTNPLRAATFKDNLYVQNGVEAAKRWSGSVATALGSTFNDNLQAPSGGNMPQAKCIAVWQGSVWIAGVTEGGVLRPNRVRWSHPNFPEDYRSTDFIDVDTGVDGDEIVGLAPFGDRLIIFKRKSIHAIYGHGPDAFSVLPVSQSCGATSQEAIVNTDAGLFFFSWPQGVFRYDGKRVDWIFDRLYPAISRGSIPDAYQNTIRLGWADRRLWAAVPWGSSSTNARTFVLDPSVGKGGAWVAYDLPLGSIVEWKPPSADALGLAIAGSGIVKLNQDQAFDDFGAGPVHIASWYRTRFIDFGQPAVRKRWKRPEIVLMGGTTATVLVEHMRDYDASLVSGSFRLEVVADPNTFMWDGDAAHGWDSGATWGRSAADVNELVKGSSLGTARSVSLKFNGPTTNSQWGIDSIAMKFIPKPVRS